MVRFSNATVFALFMTSSRNVGKEVNSDEYEMYLKELKVFRNWFEEHLMSTDPQTLSNAIMIMPYGVPDPEYRDEPNPY
jgi:hypothetical protein